MAAAPEQKLMKIVTAVRIRPANDGEQRGAFRNMIEPVAAHGNGETTMLVFDPPRLDEKGLTRRQQIGRRRPKNLHMVYDRVFGPEASQNTVFEATTLPLIDGVLRGCPATVFAYGATGAGKTHTMIGNATAGPGVMVRAVERLFELIAREASAASFSLRISYLEVYNERIRDLLPYDAEGGAATARRAATAGKENGGADRENGGANGGVERQRDLALRDDGKSGIEVAGLAWHEIVDAPQASAARRAAPLPCRPAPAQPPPCRAGALNARARQPPPLRLRDRRQRRVVALARGDADPH